MKSLPKYNCSIIKGCQPQCPIQNSKMFWFGHGSSKNKVEMALGDLGEHPSLNKKILEKHWDCDEDEKK